MKVAVPEIEAKQVVKSAVVKLAWKTDKDGNPFLQVSAACGCELESGGTVRPTQSKEYDLHDEPAVDFIKLFERFAKPLGLNVDISGDTAEVQTIFKVNNGEEKS